MSVFGYHIPSPVRTDDTLQIVLWLVIVPLIVMIGSALIGLHAVGVF